MNLAGRRVLVLGSAPLPAPLEVPDDMVVVAVNGGIGSYARCDIWVVNSRNIDASSWSPSQRRLSLLMLAQGAERTVETAVLLTKSDDAAAWTLRHLTKQRTRVAGVIEIHNEQRRRLEAEGGGRTGDMTKQALSAGMFAATWALWQEAALVRLEGFSWVGGYDYLPGEVFPVRGHLVGDRQALHRLTARYPGRLIHHLEEKSMVTKNRKGAASATRISRPSAASQSTSRTARRAAIASTTPAAERAKKVAAATAPAPAAEKVSDLDVEATETTFYGGRRYRAGERFKLRDATNFRPSCMKHVDPNAPKTAPAPPDVSDGRTPDVSRGTRPRDDNPLGVE